MCPPDSEVARVMEQTAAGWCVNPDDAGAIEQVLTEIHTLGGKYPRKRNWEAIRRYERPRLAAEYAQVIRDASRMNEEREFDNFSAAERIDREGDRDLAARA